MENIEGVDKVSCVSLSFLLCIPVRCKVVASKSKCEVLLISSWLPLSKVFFTFSNIVDKNLVDVLNPLDSSIKAFSA